jgi:hypothetical protein
VSIQKSFKQEEDKMKKQIITGIGVCLLFLIAAAVAFSQSTKQVQSQIPQVKVKEPYRLQLAADPLVQEIYAGQCPCAQDLGSVNAFLMKDMWVTIFNGVCPGNKMAQVSATLKVRYYDLRLLRWEEKNIPFTVDANRRKAIKVINGKVLVKKSTGITAEIVNIKAPVKDCDTSNNKKTVRACYPPPVY